VLASVRVTAVVEEGTAGKDILSEGTVACLHLIEGAFDAPSEFGDAGVFLLILMDDKSLFFETSLGVEEIGIGGGTFETIFLVVCGTFWGKFKSYPSSSEEEEELIDLKFKFELTFKIFGGRQLSS
jgi:hypothetical protein